MKKGADWVDEERSVKRRDLLCKAAAPLPGKRCRCARISLVAATSFQQASQLRIELALSAPFIYIEPL